jgi:hypothetical protein
VIDKTAKARGVRHVDVRCGGGTSVGSRCRRFQWFPEDARPEFWLYHDHNNTKEAGRV